MKLACYFTVFILLTSSPALADWAKYFSQVYYEKGIDDAVVMALSEGASPYQIIKEGLPIKDLKKEILLKALFCALAQPETIHEAAKENSIGDDTVDKGFQLALIECKRQMEENLNSTIIQSSRFPELAPSKRTRRTVYGSPWKFE